MTTLTLTEAQSALKAYYETILRLETAGVINHNVGDALSAEMMANVGDYCDYEGDIFCG